MKNLLLAFCCVLLVPGAQDVPPHERRARFGRSLLAVADQDGDGVRELLIADQTQFSGESCVFYVWSPSKKRCLRRFDHATRTSDSPNGMTLIQGIEGADFAYVGCRVGSKKYGRELILASSLSGEIVRRLTITGPTGGIGYASVTSLGNIDEEPGDEVLIRGRFKLDSDPKDEFAPFRGLLLSSGSGKTLRIEKGYYLTPLTDLDDDGVREYGMLNQDHFRVVDGRCGEEIYRFRSEASDDDAFYGLNIHPMRDLSGDGIPDLLESVHYWAFGNIAHGAAIRLRSGANGEKLWESEAVSCTGYAATRAVTVEDHDEDDVPDIVVTLVKGIGGWGGGPDWRLISGVTGVVIEKHPWKTGGDMWARGVSLTRLDDLNGDGCSDLAISHTKPFLKSYGDGFIEIFSSRGELLDSILPSDVEDKAKEDEEE